MNILPPTMRNEYEASATTTPSLETPCGAHLNDENDARPLISWAARPSLHLTLRLPRDVEIVPDPAPPPSERSLPPIDEGRHAWTFLLGAFLTEALITGGSFAFSIFQDYLSLDPRSPLRGSNNNVNTTVVGTFFLSLSYIAPALLQGLWTHLGRYDRIAGMALICLGALSLFIASFGKSTAFLAIFMGLIPGVTLGLSLINYLVWLPQWFSRRRGLANGIAFAGAGTGGIVYPFIFQATLQHVGFGWTSRIWALLVAVGGCLAALLVRPRLPREETSRASRPTTKSSDLAAYQSENSSSSLKGYLVTQARRIAKSYRYLGDQLFLLNATATLLASNGFFAIGFYLAMYSHALGLEEATVTGLVSIFNASALIGEILVGHACDHISYPLLQALIGSIASLATLALFGSQLASNFTGVIFFVLIFGLSAGSTCSLWTPMADDVARFHQLPTANVLLVLTIPRGIAAALGPLIAACLYRTSHSNPTEAVSPSDFWSVRLFVGLNLGALFPMAWLVRAVRRRAEEDNKSKKPEETF